MGIVMWGGTENPDHHILVSTAHKKGHNMGGKHKIICDSIF